MEKEKKEKLPKEYEEDKLKREEEKKGALIYIWSVLCSLCIPKWTTGTLQSLHLNADWLLLCVHSKNDQAIVMLYWSAEAEKSEDSAGGGWQGVLQRNFSQDCSFKDNMYHVGDYVYVEPTEPNLQPHIVCIERLWQDDAGTTFMFVVVGGILCLKPLLFFQLM